MASNSSLQITGSPSSPFKRLRVGSSSSDRRPESYVSFASLSPGVDSTVKVMVCRRWDATNTTGKYISTEFIFSDSMGNVIHCVARISIAHCFASKLEVGEIYSIRRFTVLPNRDTYRIRRDDAYMMQLEGYSIVRKLDSSSDGFEKYPVDLLDIEYIALNGNHFLVDIIGCVVNMGKLRPTNNGSQLLNFEVKNERGRSIKVTLWGALCDDLIRRVRGAPDPYIIVLPSLNVKEYRGIAALLLPGGRTAHSRFVIPIELLENSTCRITQNSHLAQLMHEVKLIIWDEAPMTHRLAFEALNRTLQDIMGIKDTSNRQKLFGGIPVMLGGDFRQILHVITKGKRQEIVQACISNSPLWEHCEVFTLLQNMRVNEQTIQGEIDAEKAWIKHVGDGNAPAIALEEEDEESWIEIPDQYIIKPNKTPIQQLVDEIYPNFNTNQSNRTYLQERAILTPLNHDADQINNHMFDILQGTFKLYKSSDEICMASTETADQHHMYLMEFLNNLDFPGMPPHALTLKHGLPVMLLRNVNPTQGLCNGTRLIITHLGDWVVEAEIMMGTCIGNRVVIPRITLSSTQIKWPFVMKRRQFPIKPCFAMTINKSQGQSLKHVGLYLPKPVFTHGQLYVAISRVTNPKGLKVLILPIAGQPKNHTRNVVYKEAFNGIPTATQV